MLTQTRNLECGSCLIAGKEDLEKKPKRKTSGCATTTTTNEMARKKKTESQINDAMRLFLRCPDKSKPKLLPWVGRSSSNSLHLASFPTSPFAFPFSIKTVHNSPKLIFLAKSWSISNVCIRLSSLLMGDVPNRSVAGLCHCVTPKTLSFCISLYCGVRWNNITILIL